ncbi:hypothetical protein [Variovorax sp. UC122_21]
MPSKLDDVDRRFFYLEARRDQLELQNLADTQPVCLRRWGRFPRV